MNADRCRPRLSDAEVHWIASSVGRYPIAPPWVLDPVTFASGPDLTHTEWATLIVLCRSADDDGYVYGGNWIGEKTRRSYPATYRALLGLECKGRIIYVDGGRRKDEHGRWRANRYLLVDPPPDTVYRTDKQPTSKTVFI